MCAKKISHTVLLSLSVFSFSASFSQTVPARYELGINLGAYVYQGDLTPGKLGSLKTIKPGVGVSFSKIMTPSFSVRALLNIASLGGNESLYSDPEYRQFRAFKFNNRIKELSVLGQWNFPGRKDGKLEPYVFAGVGMTYMNVAIDYSGFIPEYFSEAEKIEAGLAEDITKGSTKIIPVIPAGIGLRYKSSSSLSVNLEAMYRFTVSDYIDGYSKAVNPAQNDKYYSLSIGVSYKVGRNNKQQDCPVMKY